MSRVGKKPVAVPDQVQVKIEEATVRVEGPKGKLSLTLHPRIRAELAEKQIVVRPVGTTALDRSLHGLSRTLIANMVLGVSQGFFKELDIEGVGFRAALEGKKLNLALGFSHPIVMDIPEGIEIKVEKQTHLRVSGVDKALVGQVAANIRSYFPPEPYKGKGVRYTGEVVRRKQGKSLGGAAKGAGA